MADNTVLNAGSGGDTIASDDVGGVKYQVVKLAVGADGAANLVANANPIPIADAGGSITVDGSVSLAAAVPAGTNNIGDVDVLTLPAVAGGAAQDAAITGNPVPTGWRASSAAPTDMSADGDIVYPWATRKGALNVVVRDSAGDSVMDDTNNAIRCNIVAGAAAGGTSAADDADFTAASTAGTPIMGTFESIPTPVTDGDMGIVGITTNRELKVSVTSGGITGRAEDSASSGGEDGVPIVVVRRDTPGSGVGADGDWANLSCNSAGALYVTGGGGGTQYAEDAAHVSGDTGTMALGVRKDTATQLAGTDGDYCPAIYDASGRMHVNVGALPASTNTIEVVGDVAHDAAAAGNPVLAGAYASAAAPTDVSADADAVRLWALRSGALAVQPTYAGVLGVAGNGASGTGVPRVTLANDSTGVLAAVTNVATIGTSVTPGTAAANLGKAEDAAHTSGDVGVFALAVRTDTAAASSGTNGDYEALHTDSVGALWNRSTGELTDDAAFTPGTSRVMPVGFTADETATDSVDEGDVGIPRITLDRKQIVTQYAHAAAGGATPYKNLDVDETEDDIKTSAGKLYWIHVVNLANAKRYLKIYNNVAASVTVGTTTPDLTFPIPTMGDTNGAGFCLNFGDHGLQFSTGICIAATTGFADNDTGAPGANEIIFNAGYA